MKMQEADEHRMKGNDFFRGQKYEEAVQEYSKAVEAVKKITESDNVGVKKAREVREFLFVCLANRIQAYLSLGRFEEGKRDAENASEMAMDSILFPNVDECPPEIQRLLLVKFPFRYAKVMHHCGEHEHALELVNSIFASG